MNKDKHINDQNIDENLNENISNETINDSEIKNETGNNELEEKLKKLEKEIADSNDRLLRKAAEFENYKRRTEANQINFIKYDGESFITKLLPAIDDFERSIQHLDTAKDIIPIKEGIKLVYNKLTKILNEQGIHKIDAVGKSFDVNLHEAIRQQKAEGVKPHTVLDEVEMGYMYKDKVIRHSKVIVSEDVSEDQIAESTDQSGNKNTGE